MGTEQPTVQVASLTPAFPMPASLPTVNTAVQIDFRSTGCPCRSLAFIIYDFFTDPFVYSDFEKDASNMQRSI